MSNAAAPKIALEPDARASLHPFGRVALLLMNIFIFVGLFSLGPALPYVRAQFASAPNVDLGVQLVGSAAGLAFAVVSLLVGEIFERIEYRRVFMGALGAFALFGVGGVLVENLPIIILSRIGVGAASACIMTASLVAVGKVGSATARAQLLGMQQFVGCTAAIVLYPVMGVVSQVNWRYPFFFHIFALIVIPMVLTLPAAALSQQNKAPHAARRVGNLGPMLLLTIVLVGMVIFISSVFGSLYLAKLGETRAIMLSLPSTATAAGAVAGSGLFIWLQTRLGIERTFAICLAAIVAGLAIVGLSTTGISVAVGTLVIGLGTGAFAPNLNAAAIRAAPLNPSRTLGVANGLMYGSMILFPLAAVPFSQRAGGASILILSFAALASVAAVGFLIQAGSQSKRAPG